MKQSTFHPGSDFRPATRVAIIIPARNEAANIQNCLRSLLEQDYPMQLVEIIVVDDHSTDDTAALATAMGVPVRVISLAVLPASREPGFAFKKQALNAGITHSQGSLIITTDADCMAPPQWLKQVVELYEQKEAAMIIGPVAFTNSGRMVEQFQSLDFTTMQGITAAAHRLRLGSMANGANLAFSRFAFNEVKGYTGIDHLNSGDDYLLLHKMQQRFPDDIHYLKSPEAVIRTLPQPDWSSFLQQRVRWASKTGKYSDHRLTAILALVYLFNATILGILIAACLLPGLWLTVAGMMAVKIMVELLFLIPVAQFFNKGRELFIFPFLQPLHILYIVLTGFLGMRGSYRWKGRTLR